MGGRNNGMSGPNFKGCDSRRGQLDINERNRIGVVIQVGLCAKRDKEGDNNNERRNIRYQLHNSHHLTLNIGLKIACYVNTSQL